MSYRPPGVPPKGRWARFLHQMRQDRGWSQQRGFEELREGLHFGPKSRASYVAIEAGRRIPTPDEAAYLISYFGKNPDDLPEPPGATETGDALASAIEALVVELRAWRTEDRDRIAAVERGMERLLASRPPGSEGGGSPARYVPRGTEG